MNKNPNLKAAPLMLNKSDKPAPSLRYGLIWFFNALVTGLAIGFFITTGMGTSEFLDDWEGLIFLAIISLTWIVPVVGIGTAIFFVTKRILEKKASDTTTSRRWLSVPAWIFALGVFVYGLWNIMPQQRLAKVCGGTSITAQNIKVVGCTGMQMGQWLAVFEVKEDDFQKIVQKQQLQQDSVSNFTDKLDRAVMLRRTSLFVSLPAVTNSQCFKREVLGVDGIIHGGVYAAYDSKTSRAVVFREGY